MVISSHTPRLTVPDATYRLIHPYNTIQSILRMSRTAYFYLCVLAITCSGCVPVALAWTLSSSSMISSSFSSTNSLVLRNLNPVSSDHDDDDDDTEKYDHIQNILQPHTSTDDGQYPRRRSFLQHALIGSFCLVPTTLLSPPPPPAHAQPAEFQTIGTQTPAVRPGDPSFITLPNGVKFADFVVGQGADAVPGNNAPVRVDIQCNGRLLNLNGVSFYNTKNNNPDGFGAIPLTLILGRSNRGGAKGSSNDSTTTPLPGLETGLVGMRKGGIRRIIVPSELAYSKFPTLQPQPTTDAERRALDSVIQNPRRDATIMFDVKLERFKTL